MQKHCRKINKCILLISLLLPLQTFCQSKSKKIEVLIVDGFSNHDWKQTTQVVKTILQKSQLFNISVSTTPSESDDKGWTIWNPEFEKFDVVIQNTNNINNKEIKWPKRVEKELEDYVKPGGGLYILHSSNNAFSHWGEYDLMIGLGWRSKEAGMALQIADDGSVIKIPSEKGKGTYHGPRSDQIIHILNDHPINKDFPKKWKTPDMELYKYARGPGRNITVLSYATDSTTNINWPVEWVIKYGNGKVYNSSMGHLWKGQTYPISYKCIGFQTTLIRATEWLAKGKTTYPVPKKFPSVSKVSLVK